MKHALVSGGAGFIGSHLCGALLEQGTAVTCLDNFCTGSVENVASLQGHPHFHLWEADATKIDLEAPLPFRRSDLAYVFHLASPASVVDYLRLPLETMRVNSEGTGRLLELARLSASRFLMASTSEVYGDPLEHPQRETYWGNVSPNGLRSPYDESKRFAEALTAQYVRSFGLDGRIVRIFNTYGPHSRLDDGRVVPNLVGQALLGQPLSIYGDGQQTRSFCYVSDLVEGLVAAVLTPGQAGEVFNLGNPDEHTILEFAQIVQRLCHELGGPEPPGLEWRDLPVDDPTRRRPDIGKAQAVLGWEPRVDLEAGLRRTIAWFMPRVRPQPPESMTAAASARVGDA